MIYAFTGKKNSGKNTAASMVNYIVNGFEFGDWKDSHDGLCHLYFNDVVFEEKSFASKVKDVCSILTGIPREHWDNRELRDIELPIEGLKHACVRRQMEVKMTTQNDVIWKVVENYTYRTFMQRVGTEAMRDCIHQDVWVNALMQEYKEDIGWEYEIEMLPGEEPKELNSKKGMSITDFEDTIKRAKVVSEPQQVNNGYPNWIITDLRFDNEAKAVKAVGGIVIEIDRNSSTDNDPHASEQVIHTDYVDHFIGNNSTLEELFDKIKLVINDRSNTSTNL